MAELSRSRPPEAVSATPDAGTHAHSVPQCLWTRPGVRGTPTVGPTLGKSRIHPLVTKDTLYLEFTLIIKKHNYMMVTNFRMEDTEYRCIALGIDASGSV